MYDIQFMLWNRVGSFLNKVPEDVIATGLVPRYIGYFSKLIRNSYLIEEHFLYSYVIKIGN